MNRGNNSQDRVVLITGAGGFIGEHAVKAFAAVGWRVIALSRGRLGGARESSGPTTTIFLQHDLNGYENLVHVLKVFRPSACLHLAAPSSVPASFQQPPHDFASHILPFMNLLEAVRRAGSATKVLLISSAAVYGNPSALPVREDQEASPLSPYGYHKLHQELLLDQYRSLHGVRGCKARVFSTYGIGLRRLAVWDITRKALSGDHTLYGTGSESRDYLHANDVAQALLRIVENAAFDGESINVAAGCEVPILELAETIYKILETDAKPRLVPPPPDTGNPLRWCADITRLRDLGFAPQVGLQQGLSATVEWIRSHV